MRRTVTACLTILAASGLALPTANQPAAATSPAVPARPELAAGVAIPANPGTTSRMTRLREEAAKVRADIERFEDDIAELVEEYNTHNQALGETRAELQETAARLDRAQARLRAAKRQLKRRARAVYIWQQDPFTRYGQLLGVRGLHEVTVAHGYQSWVMNADERAVARVLLAQRSLEALSARLQAQHERQEGLVDRVEQEREAIERRVDEQRSYLDRLTDQIRRLVERQDRSLESRRHRDMLHRIAEDRRQRDRDDRRRATRRARSFGRAGGVGRLAVRWALRQVGKPYRWGASGPGAFDCSGLTMRAYHNAGVQLPRTSRAQFHAGRRVHRLADLRPGDLLFFGRSWRSIHHVGVYIGGGRMVHAPNSGSRVRVSSIARRNFVGAARP